MNDKHDSTLPGNHDGVSHEVAARMAELSAEATAAVADAAELAGKQLQISASRAEQLAKRYPWAAAGAVLGLGMILGAVAHRLLAHRPTVYEMLGVDALPSKAKRAMVRYL